MRRILILSLSYYPHLIGGAEVAVKEITDRIQASDIQFDMITMGDGRSQKEGTIGNVKIYRVTKRAALLDKLIFPFHAARKAHALHAKQPYDAVWSIMASYAGYAAHLFKKKYPDVPVILTIQEGDHFERREGFFAPLFRKIFAAADRIQVISNYLAEWSVGMGARCPITVVPNGVNYEHFHAPISVSEREDLRRDLGFADDNIVLVTASRLVYKNAVDDIISSLASLDEAYRFLILGTGPDEAKLRSQARALGVEGRIVFKGFVSHEELPKYLQASDVFVRPSRTEGLGNSFLEAMAAGIPVVATAVGGIIDFLKDGETGLFAEVGNPESIAQKVVKLGKDRESRDYIVRQADMMVKDRYGWDSIAVRMKEVLVGNAE